MMAERAAMSAARIREIFECRGLPSVMALTVHGRPMPQK